jgi:hypothetical protein
MITRWRRSFLFAVSHFVLTALFVSQTSALATTPRSPTVVCQKDGKWQLRNDYLGGSRILLIDSGDKTKLLLWIKDAIPAGDYEKFVDKTTAGPKWDHFAFSTFLTFKGKPLFCIRTWWDRRIVIDLEDAKQITERGIEAALDNAERKAMLEVLQGGASVASKKAISVAAFFKLQAAVHLAGRLTHDKEIVGLIRQLEPLGFETSNTLGEYGPDVDWKAGEIGTGNYSTHELRRVVQLSLRRLGEAPAEFPVTSFRPHDSKKPFEPRRWGVPRVERVPSLQARMTPKEVIETVGFPDYVERGQSIHREGPWETAWRYDIDAKAAYTLLLVWDGHAVKKIEKISPPLWKPRGLASDDSKKALINADGSIRSAELLYRHSFKGTITVLE